MHAFTDRRRHEVVGVGVLAPGENGKIGMHMHAAMGVPEKQLPVASVPASRPGWWRRQSVYEITGIDATRVLDKTSGFALLQVK